MTGTQDSPQDEVPCGCPLCRRGRHHVPGLSTRIWFHDRDGATTRECVCVDAMYRDADTQSRARYPRHPLDGEVFRLSQTIGPIVVRETKVEAAAIRAATRRRLLNEIGSLAVALAFAAGFWAAALHGPTWSRALVLSLGTGLAGVGFVRAVRAPDANKLTWAMWLASGIGIASLWADLLR